MIDTIRELLGRMQWTIIVGDETATETHIHLLQKSATTTDLHLNGTTYGVLAFSITLMKHILEECGDFTCQRIFGDTDVTLRITSTDKSRVIGESLSQTTKGK